MACTIFCAVHTWSWYAVSLVGFSRAASASFVTGWKMVLSFTERQKRSLFASMSCLLNSFGQSRTRWPPRPQLKQVTVLSFALGHFHFVCSVEPQYMQAVGFLGALQACCRFGGVGGGGPVQALLGAPGP